DARNVDNERDFINAINHHLKYATNDGKIKPYITIFSPDQAPRIFNNQLIRYAGYEHCGDPFEREVTQLAEHLGWKGAGTDFDVLPLIYQLPNDSIKLYELPHELVKE
ncbi:nitric oxide synthase oxygenase, partial [Staphylococcus aureus]|nr:nitric oxide synthase oxygenase [Staphylococcus aureus]